MSCKTQRIIILLKALIFLLVRLSPGQPLHPDKELSQYSLDRVASDKIPAGILKMILSTIKNTEDYIITAMLLPPRQKDGTFLRLTNGRN